eukprot:scaffold7531_cov66-Attheya_sp.AAC.1
MQDTRDRVQTGVQTTSLLSKVCNIFLKNSDFIFNRKTIPKLISSIFFCYIKDINASEDTFIEKQLTVCFRFLDCNSSPTQLDAQQ